VNTGAALFRAICARPDDDAPRLVYADWLEDYAAYTPNPGTTGTRAESIRFQVELARTLRNVGGYEPGTARPGRHAGTGVWPRCDLAVRAEELFGRLPPESAGTGAGPGTRAVSFPDLRHWERGFPASVERIDAELWLVHADDILARYPIRRVALTDWPAADIFDRGLRTFRFRGWRPHQFTDWVDPSRTDQQFVRRMLAEEWPGIAFELPPGRDQT
jgi:uncharacterized protein (TIGR02996 family)